MIMTFLANIENPEDLLKEIKRILKKEGIVVGSVFAENALPERMKMYESIPDSIEKINKEKGIVYFKGDKSIDNISRQMNEHEILELFEKFGFKLINIEKVSIGYNFAFKQ